MCVCVCMCVPVKRKMKAIYTVKVGRWKILLLKIVIKQLSFLFKICLKLRKKLHQIHQECNESGSQEWIECTIKS